jgi:hypothetical protein
MWNEERKYDVCDNDSKWMKVDGDGCVVRARREVEVERGGGERQEG